VVINAWLKNTVLTQRAASHRSGPSVKGPSSRSWAGKRRSFSFAFSMQMPPVLLPQSSSSSSFTKNEMSSSTPELAGSETYKGFFPALLPMPPHIDPISIDDVRRGILSGSPLGRIQTFLTLQCTYPSYPLHLHGPR